MPLCYHFFGAEGSLTLPQMQHVFYPDPAKEGWQYPTQMDRLSVKPAHPLRLEMSHFCRVIRKEETPRTTARDARKTLEGVLAIMQSRDTGQAVELNKRMNLAIAQSLPIISLVVVGLLLKQAGLIRPGGGQVMTRLIVNTTFPAIIFLSVSRANVTPGKLAVLALCGILVSLGLRVASGWWANHLKLERQLADGEQLRILSGQFLPGQATIGDAHPRLVPATFLPELETHDAHRRFAHGTGLLPRPGAGSLGSPARVGTSCRQHGRGHAHL